MAVHYQVEGDVAVITLSRPDRFNSVSAELATGLVSALDRAGDEARAAVLTGSGKAFCAGADLSDLMSEYESGGPDLDRVLAERFNPIAIALHEARIPTVAAVNGVAAGAGMALALGCDLRIMSAEAYFLSAFIGLGLIPDTGSTWLLVHHLGLARAIEFTCTNRRMSAAEAAGLGLARSISAEDLLAEATTQASTLAQGPTAAYVENRKILYGAASLGFLDALEEERSVQGALGVTPDHIEGMRAFIEKRPAKFGSSPERTGR
ncbi:MAG TPA: enoyl-CoA hydratase-related protein [Acidimicrobiia bacterium]|nr:enoyl-CoA hydratase-related protein [Acidimicrobiia bacterium]